MAETLPIKPADLLIDEENPRISEPNDGQNNAIRSLAEHLGPKLQVLAEDIVNNGINPADLPFVMLQPGSTTRYIVLEGNRRLAAIRVLESPETIGDAVAPGVLNKIRKLSRTYQGNPIEEITCVVVADREEARHWIELRHTGENGGAGLVPWGSDESARYRARASGASEAHVQALDFLQQRGHLTPDVRRAVPATSLKRLIETPEVRARIGVEIQKGILRLRAEEARVAKALSYLVNDLASGKTKVGQIYTKAQRVAYAKRLPADVVVTATIPSGQGPVASTGVTVPAATAKGARGAKRAKKRDRLIPPDCVLSIPPGRLADIEHELRRKLSLEDHTNAVSVLFRVFVELSVDAYLDKHPLGIDRDAKLRVKIEKVAIDLETRKKINKQQGRAIRAANMSHSTLAPGANTMNDYIHNEHIFPAPSDLRQHWSSLQPLIAAMWTP